MNEKRYMLKFICFKETSESFFDRTCDLIIGGFVVVGTPFLTRNEAVLISYLKKKYGLKLIRRNFFKMIFEHTRRHDTVKT